LGYLGNTKEELMGKVWNTTCAKCGCATPHAEDPVPDKESATVWHCLFCGNEKRPNEPGTPNEPVLV
jgi:RNase P subunit RPR2